MRLRREHLSTVVQALQVIFLHVQFASCALPPSRLHQGRRDNGLHRDTAPHHQPAHRGSSGSSATTTTTSSTSSSNSRNGNGGSATGSEASPPRRGGEYPHHQTSASASASGHKQHWNYDTPDPSGAAGWQSRQHRWAKAAFQFVQGLDCQAVFFTTSRECQALVRVPRHAMNVYLAAPSPYGQFRTSIPEEPLTGPRPLQEAVLVVDPYPRANFGHLLVVFFIDSRVSRGHCRKMGGVYLGKVVFFCCCCVRLCP